MCATRTQRNLERCTLRLTPLAASRDQNISVAREGSEDASRHLVYFGRSTIQIQGPGCAKDVTKELRTSYQTDPAKLWAINGPFTMSHFQGVGKGTLLSAQRPSGIDKHKARRGESTRLPGNCWCGQEDGAVTALSNWSFLRRQGGVAIAGSPLAICSSQLIPGQKLLTTSTTRRGWRVDVGNGQAAEQGELLEPGAHIRMQSSSSCSRIHFGSLGSEPDIGRFGEFTVERKWRQGRFRESRGAWDEEGRGWWRGVEVEVEVEVEVYFGDICIEAKAATPRLHITDNDGMGGTFNSLQFVGEGLRRFFLAGKESSDSECLQRVVAVVISDGGAKQHGVERKFRHSRCWWSPAHGTPWRSHWLFTLCGSRVSVKTRSTDATLKLHGSTVLISQPHPKTKSDPPDHHASCIIHNPASRITHWHHVLYGTLVGSCARKTYRNASRPRSLGPAHPPLDSILVGATM
ncbi:hypothetical protein BC827DRAFT_1151784 [Russula dissimulans]|nr:hypothetical protein BC827DRAFT_1151784 [Russula dissimulans]